MPNEFFDSALVAELYDEYRMTASREVLTDIHEASRQLIEVLAVSMRDSLVSHDDLCQEGHIKLQELVFQGSYNRSRGSMYSFLTSALRNRMLDMIRGERDHDDISEYDELLSGNGLHSVSVSHSVHTDELCSYMDKRFPSLRDEIVNGAVKYILAALQEGCSGGYKGVVRTLCTTFVSDRPMASAVYFSTLSIIRMDCMGYDWLIHRDDALLLLDDCTMERTLMPEVVLLLGMAGATVLSFVFGGYYVKF